MRTTGKRKISYKTLLLLTAIGLVISGCAQSKFYLEQPVDNNDKSITLPVSSSGAMFDIKKYLKENGWVTKVYRGPTKIQGTVGRDTNVQTYDTFNTRYTLSYRFRPYAYSICGLAINFSLSVIDNKSGEEVFIVSGETCEDNVIEKFRVWTEGRPIK